MSMPELKRTVDLILDLHRVKHAEKAMILTERLAYEVAEAERHGEIPSARAVWVEFADFAIQRACDDIEYDVGPTAA